MGGRGSSSNKTPQWVSSIPSNTNLFLYSKDNQAKDKRYLPVGNDWGQVDRVAYARIFKKDNIQKVVEAIEKGLPQGMSIQVRDYNGKVYYPKR